MDRWVVDLAEARTEKEYMLNNLKYLYVGDCDGEVTIKIGRRSASALNPDEFDKLTDVKQARWIYITNTAQAGKKLVFYVEEDFGREEDIK